MLNYLKTVLYFNLLLSGCSFFSLHLSDCFLFIYIWYTSSLGLLLLVVYYFDDLRNKTFYASDVYMFV